MSLPFAKQIKYEIISDIPEATGLFESLMTDIKRCLKQSYDPRHPFSIEVNMTKRLSSMNDTRMQSILYEAIVETYRDLGWIVKQELSKNNEEIIYIQRHK